MIHIVLTILKIIGIVLAALFLLFILLALCVLFVPLRYRSKGSYYGKADVCLSISWLFRMIYVRIMYKDEKVVYKIRLFGIPLNVFRFLKRKDKDSDNDHETPSDTKSFSDAKTSNDIFEYLETKTSKEAQTSSDVWENASKDANASKDTNASKDAWYKLKRNGNKSGIEPEITSKTTEASKGTEEDEKEPESNDGIRGILNLWMMLIERFKKIILSIKNIKSIILNSIYKFKDIYGKIKKIKDFAFSALQEENKDAIRHIKAQLFILLKHMKPTKIKGKFRFGFEDPVLTGSVLATISMFYGWYENKIIIIPEFEKTVFEAEYYVKGRIRTFTILKAFIKLYRHDRIKQWIRAAL